MKRLWINQSQKFPQSIIYAEAPSNATSVTQWNRKLFHNYPTVKAFQAYEEEVCRLDKRGRHAVVTTFRSL